MLSVHKRKQRSISSLENGTLKQQIYDYLNTESQTENAIKMQGEKAQRIYTYGIKVKR